MTKRWRSESRRPANSSKAALARAWFLSRGSSSATKKLVSTRSLAPVEGSVVIFRERGAGTRGRVLPHADEFPRGLPARGVVGVRQLLDLGLDGHVDLGLVLEGERPLRFQDAVLVHRVHIDCHRADLTEYCTAESSNTHPWCIRFRVDWIDTTRSGGSCVTSDSMYAAHAFRPFATSGTCRHGRSGMSRRARRERPGGRGRARGRAEARSSGAPL